MDLVSFITYLQSEKRSSAHTVAAYRTDLEQFQAYVLRAFELSDLREVSSAVVRSWIAELMEEQYSATSVHRKISAVTAFYKYMLRQGEIRVNPARGLAKPKRPKRLPVFVDERGAMALYEPRQEGDSDFSELRNRLMVTLFYETGIRLSELMGLEDRDVDASIGQIRVLGKRNKMRLVPLSADMLKSIHNYQRIRDKQPFEKEPLALFVTDRGKKLNRTFVYQTVKRYLSGVTTVGRKSPHVLRHTFATHLLNNGAELNVIKEILGHTSLAATQVYTHLSVEKLKGIHQSSHPRSER